MFIRLILAMFLFMSAMAGAACNISPGFDVLNVAVKGFAIPRTSPVAGVEYVTPAQVKTMLSDTDQFRMIDVRPESFYTNCRIKGSENLEYTFSGPGGEDAYSSPQRLTRQQVEDSVENGQTLVFFCNNAFGQKGCWRAANASITAVCDWGVAPQHIKWFGMGVPGMYKTFPELTEGRNCSMFDKPATTMK